MRTLSTPLPHTFCARASLRMLGLALVACVSGAFFGCASPHPLMEQKADTATGVKTTELTGSEKVLWVFSPYRIEVQQGNFISKEMAAQLKEGLTQDQVRFILGTPLLTDIFHADRWDYVFRLKKGNGELTTSRVTVFFKDGRLTKFEGGDLPTEAEYIERIAGSRPMPEAGASASSKDSPATNK